VIGFFALTIGFGLLIWIAGNNHPYCVGGVEFETSYFADSFTLSWTTFSTVVGCNKCESSFGIPDVVAILNFIAFCVCLQGYGLIHAGISTTEDIDDIKKCTGMTVLVTLEAFVGILFASMWGAIIFIRLSRIQSFAQVTFSDAIVSQSF